MVTLATVFIAKLACGQASCHWPVLNGRHAPFPFSNFFLDTYDSACISLYRNIMRVFIVLYAMYAILFVLVFVGTRVFMLFEHAIYIRFGQLYLPTIIHHTYTAIQDKIWKMQSLLYQSIRYFKANFLFP